MPDGMQHDRLLKVSDVCERTTLSTATIYWATTTDHKMIGNLYFITSFGFFLLGGVLAMLIRAELARTRVEARLRRSARA